MDSNYNKTLSSLWILLLLATLDTISQSYVKGLQTSDSNIFGPRPKGTIKTIEALDVGDVIDCVDIYKQPAFDNPLIKDIKMAPSSYPIAFNKTSNHQPRSIQTWTKYGECPRGTIPIRRTPNNNNTVHRKNNETQEAHEYATTIQYFNRGNGGQAVFNVWQPRVGNNKEFSLAQIWVASRGGGNMNTAEAGYMVYPKLFHDAQTRLFIFWSRDNYRKGCYNLMCAGFVQTDYFIALGGAIDPVSVYNGFMSSLFISLTKTHYGDWWLQLHDRMVGYFPGELYTTLDDGADYISFGGEIINLATGGRHTSTAMGNGHFSTEGFKKASYVSNIAVMNDKKKWVDANPHIEGVTNSACYDLTFGPPGTSLRSHFYFGGPGLSQRCQ